MSSGREEVKVFVDRFIDALERLKQRKKPISEAPLNKLRLAVESPSATSIDMKTVVARLVEAGYNADDIKEFMLYAEIIRDIDEWARLKPDIERAVILASLEKLRGAPSHEL